MTKDNRSMYDFLWFVVLELTDVEIKVMSQSNEKQVIIYLGPLYLCENYFFKNNYEDICYFIRKNMFLWSNGVNNIFMHFRASLDTKHFFMLEEKNILVNYCSLLNHYDLRLTRI